MKFKIKIEDGDEVVFEVKDFTNPSMAEYYCIKNTEKTGKRHSIVERPHILSFP